MKFRLIESGNNKIAKYRWAVYFTWNDGFEDTFNCWDAMDRDLNIKNMIQSGNFKEISYRKIYSSGEYGREVKVF